MAGESRRRISQVHLSTAIALMIVVGVILLLDVTKRQHPPLGGKFGVGPWEDELTKVGWPWDAAVNYTPDFPQSGLMPVGWKIAYCSLAADVYVAIALLLTVWAVLEFIIARRELTPVESKHRRFWQVHALTFILAMDALGAIALVNFKNYLRSEYYVSLFQDAKIGWPLIVWSDKGTFKAGLATLSLGGLAVDVMIALCVSASVASISEFLIRRRGNTSRDDLRTTVGREFDDTKPDGKRKAGVTDMKRKWFQYSLRSLVLLMLTAGAAVTLWRNIAPWQTEHVLKHGDDVNFAAFSPDGKSIVTQDDDDLIHVWDTVSGALRMGAKTSLKSVGRFTFSPDSRYIVNADDNSDTIDIWDVSTAQKRTIKENAHECRYAEFSPDGRFVATANSELEVRSVSDGALKWQWTWSVEKPVNFNFARFSPDSKKVLAVSGDNRMFVFTVDDGILRGAYLEKSDIKCAEFSPDCSFITYSCGRITAGRELESNKILYVIESDARNIRSLAFSHDGQKLLAEDAARVWDARSGAILAELEIEDDKFDKSVAFSPDARLVLSGGDDGIARIWNAHTGVQRARLVGHVDDKDINDAEFSPDGQHIVTACDDHTARIWRQRRPYEWWGVAWLPEFWLAVVIGSLLIASVWRDRRGA